MKTHHTLLLLFVFALLSCTKATQRESDAARLASLPDNPCEILSRTEVSAITGLEVTSAERVPSLDKIVQAQKENREPDPGTICTYMTRSEFGAIMITVPARSERRATNYWETRAKYAKTFPGSAQDMPGLGANAWLSGGTALHVLADGDEFFSVSIQLHQPHSRELLVSIARVVLSKL